MIHNKRTEDRKTKSGDINLSVVGILEHREYVLDKNSVSLKCCFLFLDR
jgi:hypothetical protein